MQISRVVANKSPRWGQICRAEIALATCGKQVPTLGGPLAGSWRLLAIRATSSSLPVACNETKRRALTRLTGVSSKFEPARREKVINFSPRRELAAAGQTCRRFLSTDLGEEKRQKIVASLPKSIRLWPADSVAVCPSDSQTAKQPNSQTTEQPPGSWLSSRHFPLGSAASTGLLGSSWLKCEIPTLTAGRLAQIQSKSCDFMMFADAQCRYFACPRPSKLSLAS